MATKYKVSEECISAKDARFVVEALDEHIINQRKMGVYEGDIKSTITARDAIRRVFEHASLEYDDICFIVDSGARSPP